MNTKKSAEFQGASRIHVGFAVRDLDASIAFYETLLGAPPVKVRPGYAKFEPSEPSANLSIHQSPRLANQLVAVSQGTHYGVQVKSTEAVEHAGKRLREAGYATKVEQGATCCYAVQDKVWASDPDGNEWEVFVVIDGDAPIDRDESAVEAPCCDDTCCSDLLSTESECC